LGEIHTQLISLLPGGVRDVQILSSSVLRLLGGLPRRVLRLLGGPSGGVLGTLRGLTGLVSDLPCSALSLLGGAPGGVLHALGGLPCRVGDLANRLTRNILGLPSRLTGGILDSLHGLPGLLLRLAQGVLSLLGRVAHGIVDTLIAGRLVDGAFDLRVGVDHFLQLRLRFRRGLLYQALELGPVVLSLALDPAQRVTVEVLGALHYLLLYPLLEVLYFAHSFSFLIVFLCARAAAMLLRPRGTP